MDGQLDLATIWSLKSSGRTIEAIKKVREATGWGLKEAKDYVDAMTSPPG